MSDEARWTVLERIFHAALAIEPAERAEYLRNACGNDEDLWRRLQSLLVRDDGFPADGAEFWEAGDGPGIGPTGFCPSSAPAAWATSTSRSTVVSTGKSR